MNPEEKPIAYIAGALNAMANQYTRNIHNTIIWGEKIRRLDYAVFIPGMDFLMGVVIGNLTYEEVFDNSQPFLIKSKIMFVTPGWEDSKGTAKELITAHKYNIPIYYGEEGYNLLKWQYEQCQKDQK